MLFTAIVLTLNHCQIKMKQIINNSQIACSFVQTMTEFNELCTNFIFLRQNESLLHSSSLCIDVESILLILIASIIETLDF